VEMETEKDFENLSSDLLHHFRDQVDLERISTPNLLAPDS
jgi:hypothetical protein